MIWRTTLLLILVSYQIFGEVEQNSSELSDNSKTGNSNPVEEKVKIIGSFGKGVPQVRSKRYDKYSTFYNLQKEFNKLTHGQKFEFLADNLKHLQESANFNDLSHNYISSPYNKNGDINTEIREFFGCMLLFALLTLIIYYLCYIVFDCFSGPPPSNDTTIIRGPSTIYPIPPPVYSDVSKKPIY
uniref:Pv-fam-d protein n=1 Tax=Strongyloides venezuelensis TaxID=75913 RepID=A0A0K0G1J2_STRVS